MGAELTASIAACKVGQELGCPGVRTEASAPASGKRAGFIVREGATRLSLGRWIGAGQGDGPTGNILAGEARNPQEFRTSAAKGDGGRFP